MNYLLDTCTVSYLFKKDPLVVRHFESLSPKQLYISTITIMEIEYGLSLHADREMKIRPVWEEFKRLITIIPFSENCAVRAAHLRTHLKTSGQPVGPYDILIAGSALANNLIVVTSNIKEFERMPEIIIEDWRITVV